MKNNSVSVPLYQGIYQGHEGKELTVSLRTSPCRFNCITCAWKHRNFYNIPEESVVEQIKSVLSKYKSRIPEIELFSFGNEGSLLDEKTLDFQTLLQLTKIIANYVPKISLETHIAFITQDKIDKLKKACNDRPIEFTVGFETRDDYIRQKILRKGLPLRLFEKKIELLSKNNVFIKVYVMLKPSPYMTEEEGIKECVSTIKYLYRLGAKNINPIVVHLNPTFIAKGSKFEEIAIQEGYMPPRLWSIVDVLNNVKDLPVKIYLGLSTEGYNNLPDNYVFGGCKFCDDNLTTKLKNYNKHNNFFKLLSNIPQCDCMPERVRIMLGSVKQSTQ